MPKSEKLNPIYEYTFSGKEYKKTLLWCIVLWVAILVIRLVAYSIFGTDFALGPYNLASLGLSGIILGILIKSVKITKNSKQVAVENTETNDLEIMVPPISIDENIDIDNIRKI